MKVKKFLFLLLASLLIVFLAACSGGTSSTGDNELSARPSEPNAQPSEAPVSEAPSGSETPEETTEPTDGTNGILIAYFSWSGNTEQMAQMIQAETGGTLFEIAPAVPYTDDYNELLDIAQQEQADDARPAVANQVENWDSYDVIFVGYPDWWSDAPMLIYSFLEAYDWEGKTLIPFCTSGGSAFGRSLDKIPDSASGATILEGLHVSGSRVEGAGEDIADWIGGLDLT